MIYLDHAATTPLSPGVLEAMLPYLDPVGDFANPASEHALGRRVHRAVEASREAVAQLIGASEQEIVFTSGATESNNLALKGALRFDPKRRRHLVTSKIEHKSVVDSAKQLEEEGFEVTWLTPEEGGAVSVSQVQAAIRPDTALVSLMAANNETGALTDIAAIAKLTRDLGVQFHVDAAQAVGKIPLDLQTLAIDLLSLSAHKFGGPKGIGALFVRRRPAARLRPIMHGGGHERGLRSGTLPAHQIIGLAEACRQCPAEYLDQQPAIAGLKDRLWKQLNDLPEVVCNSPDQGLAGILNVSFPFVDGESLRASLENVALSSGSACSAATSESSYVLRALGHSDSLANASLRFSLGPTTTQQEIDQVAAEVMTAVTRLRNMSPLWVDRQVAA